MIRGYPNLTDALDDDGLTECAVVVPVHLHHTDQEGLDLSANNDVQGTVVLHVSSFVSSYML